jgi:hypothetical protein
LTQVRLIGIAKLTFCPPPGTRYYDPALGRFTQVDPIAGGSLNRYDYAGQDPCNNVDPSGTFFERKCGEATFRVFMVRRTRHGRIILAVLLKVEGVRAGLHRSASWAVYVRHRRPIRGTERKRGGDFEIKERIVVGKKTTSAAGEASIQIYTLFGPCNFYLTDTDVWN